MASLQKPRHERKFVEEKDPNFKSLAIFNGFLSKKLFRLLFEHSNGIHRQILIGLKAFPR